MGIDVEGRVQSIMAAFAQPWRWFRDGDWIVLEPPHNHVAAETLHHVSQCADVHTVEAVFRSTPHLGIYLRFRLRNVSTQEVSQGYDLAARAIKSRVAAFSDQRLNDGDDVWRARELELRRAVAATANAIAVEFAGSNNDFDHDRFAAACGLYVSDGRDNYSDCHPGELTWERPRDVAATTASKES